MGSYTAHVYVFSLSVRITNQKFFYFLCKTGFIKRGSKFSIQHIKFLFRFGTQSREGRLSFDETFLSDSIVPESLTVKNKVYSFDIKRICVFLLEFLCVYTEIE